MRAPGSGRSAYAPAFQRVRLPSSTLRVARAGEGPPLLLVNGIGASIEMWSPLAARLARTHSLIMFDAPGTGTSIALRRPVRMSRFARLLVELLDHLEVERADVLGYSWGGALALQFTHDAPARVRRLVLASTSPGIGGRPPSLAVSSVMMSPLRYVSPAFLKSAAPLIYGGDARHPRAAAQPGFGSWAKNPPSYRGYTYQALAIGLWSSVPWLGRIAAPTLIIQGDDDPLIPLRNGRVLHRRIPHSTLVVVPEAGHLWLLEHPGAAAEEINAFLR